MIAWINLIVSLLSLVVTTYLYALSVSPAHLERKVGPSAYPRCAYYRKLCMASMILTFVTYCVYIFYPLPVPFPRTFPWPWWGSLIISLLIMLPSGYLLYRGVRDAGEEALTPKKEHTMYGGIYDAIRHPQAVGELILTLGMVVLFHSPFLSLISLLWIPVFLIMSWAEERDLVLRYGAPYEAYRQRTGAFLPRRKRG